MMISNVAHNATANFDEEVWITFNSMPVLVKFVEPGECAVPTALGDCTMDPHEYSATVRIVKDSKVDGVNRMIDTLVHELGHVWQLIKSNDLNTKIKWPADHYGSSKIEENEQVKSLEDFAEAFRVAHRGLDFVRDETILHRWDSRYQVEMPISDAEKKAFVLKCQEEVERLVGKDDAKYNLARTVKEVFGWDLFR